jgi:hypothetical protein
VRKNIDKASVTMPAIGSVWMYKKNPDRLYEVIHLANVAHPNDMHPPHIVYRTVRYPDHIWTRTAESFKESFSPVTGGAA